MPQDFLELSLLLSLSFIFQILVTFETLITILTIDNLNSWLKLFIWQLSVTLDSIRNSCDVLMKNLLYKLITSKCCCGPFIVIYVVFSAIFFGRGYKRREEKWMNRFILWRERKSRKIPQFAFLLRLISPFFALQDSLLAFLLLFCDPEFLPLLNVHSCKNSPTLWTYGKNSPSLWPYGILQDYCHSIARMKIMISILTLIDHRFSENFLLLG